MPIIAIIPVKPFSKGKSRLSAVLTDDERLALNKIMFSHVLRVAISTQKIDEVIVISRDSNALNMAEKTGAHAILEEDKSTLNGALETARKAASILEASALLVLPSDLAKIESKDLEIIIQSNSLDTSSVVIAPDTKLSGTNVLLLQPLYAIPFSFGKNSFLKHQKDAHKAGCKVTILERANLTFDVDEPSDLKVLSKSMRGNYS